MGEAGGTPRKAPKARSTRTGLVVPVLMGVIVLGVVLFLALRPKAPERVPGAAGITVLLAQDELSAVQMYEGALYTGGREGLYRVDVDTLEAEAVQAPEGVPPFSYVRGILAHEGDLWVAYDGAVAVLRGGVWTAVQGEAPDTRFTCLAAAPNGDVWAGSYGGAVRIGAALRTEQSLTDANGLLSSVVYTAVCDEGGNVWFGSYLERPGTGGISILRPDGSFFTLTDEDGLPHHDITSLVPYEGGMLAGCGMLDRGGAAFVAPEEGGWAVRRVWTKEDGLAGEKVRSIFLHGEDVWFCSENDGIAVWRGGAFAALLTEEQGLSDNEVKHITEGPDGTLYLASRYGLSCIPPQALDALAPQAGGREDT